MTETTEETPGIDPAQEKELAAMANDFEPEKEPIASESGIESAGIDSGQMCATCFSVVFGILAGRRGDHWALSPEESEQLGTATGAVLDKYCPDIEGGPEYALIVAAGMVVLPRVMMDKQLEAANDEAANDPGVSDGDTAASQFAE